MQKDCLRWLCSGLSKGIFKSSFFSIIRIFPQGCPVNTEIPGHICKALINYVVQLVGGGIHASRRKRKEEFIEMKAVRRAFLIRSFLSGDYAHFSIPRFQMVQYNFETSGRNVMNVLTHILSYSFSTASPPVLGAAFDPP